MEETTDIFNQENNQLLLNAIKNKFAVENASGAVHFSPSKFIIPELKSVPESSSSGAQAPPVSNATPSKLNEFILGQLNARNPNENIAVGRFALPKLQIGNQKNGVQAETSRFVIPLLNSTKTVGSYQSIYQENVTELSNEIGNLKMEDNEVENITPVIDLTAALSSSSMNSSHSLPSTSSRLELRTRSLKAPVEEFEIPFIDCDRQNTSIVKRLGTELTNEYCQVNASNLQKGNVLKRKPSTFGRIVCSKYMFTCHFPRIDHGFKVKHKIPQFRFETNSPDDVILSKLRQHRRLHT